MTAVLGPRLATCIGCGCDDHNACDLGCYWLRVDRHARKGVCSSCQDLVKPWDRGDRALRRAALATAKNKKR